MAFYSLKELIDRAIKLSNKTVTYDTISDYNNEIWELVRDLAKTNISALESRPSSALLEAARDARVALRNSNIWSLSESRLRKAIEAEEARGPCEVEELRKERDEAIVRAREAEASSDAKLRELRKWFRNCLDNGARANPNTKGTISHRDVADMVEREIDRLLAKPPSDVAQERPSSALLEAAKTVWMTSPAFSKTGPEYDHLSAVNDLYAAIKAEEARGPSEVEELRDGLGKAMHSVRRFCGAHVGLKQDYGCASCEVEQLRKERDEAHNALYDCREELGDALARVEKAEASTDAKLWKLRAIVVEQRDGDGTRLAGDSSHSIYHAEGFASASQCTVDDIDRLLAKPPSDVASVDIDDEPLVKWLNHYKDASPSTLCDAIAELVRRALGGK